MNGHVKMLVSLLCLLLSFKPCSGARQLRQNNHLFIAPSNPKLNMVIPSEGSSAPNSKDLAEKTPVAGEIAEMKPWSTSVNKVKKDHNIINMEFRSEENRSGSDSKKESPRPDHRRNAIVKVQRLSESKTSQAVGHMQEEHGVSKKRVLGSTPSPGTGN